MKLLVALSMLLIVTGAGCGKKGDPRAPELATPEPIKDLAGFVVFRKELSPSCLDCPVPYRPLTTVMIEDRDKFVKQKQYRFVDEQVQPNQVYRYRVASQ